MATPIRNFRINDDLWKAAQSRARNSGIPLSVVVKVALQNFAIGSEITLGDTEELVMPDQFYDKAQKAFDALSSQ